MSRIGLARLNELEPHVAGVDALHVPEAGIVDYVEVCKVLAREITRLGGEVSTGSEVTSLRGMHDQVTLRTRDRLLTARRAINCCGLQSGPHPPDDRPGTPRAHRSLPRRILRAQAEAESLCRGLIYPVPDPKFPFLGVHFTR
ncbi:MAG: FAD-dependent oxidoreductase [Planctomycetota bacterium]